MRDRETGFDPVSNLADCLRLTCRNRLKRQMNQEVDLTEPV